MDYLSEINILLLHVWIYAHYVMCDNSNIWSTVPVSTYTRLWCIHLWTMYTCMHVCMHEYLCWVFFLQHFCLFMEHMLHCNDSQKNETKKCKYVEFLAILI